MSVEVHHDSQYIGTFIAELEVWKDSKKLKNITGAVLELNRRKVAHAVIQPKEGGGYGI